jgi:tetratricopeptide (TPR) repeat protein
MVFTLYSIEIFLLYLLGAFYFYGALAEGTFLRLPNLDTQIYMAIIVSVFLFIIFSLFGISGIKYYFMLDALIVLGWIIFPILLFRGQKKWKKRNIIEIEGLKKMLEEKRGDEYGILLKLAEVYENSHKLEEAYIYYKRAYSLVKNITGTKAEKKTIEIERKLEKERKEKPFICVRCGKRNYKRNFFCKGCRRVLHSSYYDYLKNYAPFAIKIGLILFVFSALIFGIVLGIVENLVFYLLVIIDSIILRKLAGK